MPDLTSVRRFLVLTLFLLCAFAVRADDEVELSEPDGVVTDCEALWRAEVARFLEVAPDATFETPDEWRALEVAVAADGVGAGWCMRVVARPLPGDGADASRCLGAHHVLFATG
ncbi:hypothetical protein OT109_16130 [Phycisphaeraceae bacterium D3-23]